MTDKIDPTILIELIELGDRLTEDRLREIVVAEIERNEMDSVAQAYAFEEADGDEKKARAYYTKHRVRRIRDLIAEEGIRAAEERAEAEEKAKQKQAEEEKIARERQAKEDKIAKENKDKEADEKAKEGVKIFSYMLLVVIGMMLLGAAFG